MGLCYPGVGDEVLKQFDAWFPATRFATYVACISEHEDSEHAFGRLSMWRGFGQNAPARAAMVMKMPERGSAEGLSLILMPVAYFGYDQVSNSFGI